MADQNKSLVKWQPTKFMMNLGANTEETMAKMSAYTPVMIERQIQVYPILTDHIDSIDRSLRYFYEYEGKDKAKHIIALKAQLKRAEARLAKYSPIKSIRTISRENYGETVFHIGMMIAQLLRFFIVDKAISTNSTDVAARMIINEYPTLSLEEISICFNQAMKGYYGEDFNRLDGATIMKWLRKYQTAKNERLAMQQQERRIQHSAGNNRDRYEGAVNDNQTKLREAIIWRLKK